MKAAVLGRPVAHSLSPALHNAAYRALGLDWTYSSIECGEDELAGVLAERPDWAGFSCTMPLKRAALRVASDVSRAARAVGAANTLLPDGNGGWRADNTDVDGLLGALGPVAPSSVTVLGSGGTAQAVAVALDRLGVDHFSVLVRDRTRATAVAATVDGLGMRTVVGGLAPHAPQLAADLVISTLPAGAADMLARYPWHPDQTLLDVIYAPWPTRLAAAAAQAGATVIGGAEMLLHQAAKQVELMTGRPAPLAAMRAALG